MTDSETVEIPRDYCRALEILAADHFPSTVTEPERKEARRIVANRTGRDAPYVWDEPGPEAGGRTIG